MIEKLATILLYPSKQSVTNSIRIKLRYTKRSNPAENDMIHQTNPTKCCILPQSLIDFLYALLIFYATLCCDKGSEINLCKSFLY